MERGTKYVVEEMLQMRKRLILIWLVVGAVVEKI